MGEIIQYEGVAYKKVNRKAHEGDVVICKNVQTVSSVKEGKPYKVLEGWKVDIGQGVKVCLYHGRTEADVDVFERSPRHDMFMEAQDMPAKGLQHFTDKPKAYKEIGKPHLAESQEMRTERHLKHWFYKSAEKYREAVRHEQIVKGSEKYPEPFTPSSWTVRELLDHAMQENVDQAHYIYGLFEKVSEMENELQELREFRDNVQKTVVKWGAMNEPKGGNA